MTTIEMEIALSEYLGIRQKLVIPNIHWGLALNHECDLFVLTNTGYAYEIEIKISKADLLRDKKKRHGHYSEKIKYLFFAIPDYLEDSIKEIPKEAGILMVDSKTLSVKTLRKPTNKSNYKFTLEERYKVARLGALRIWTLKKNLLKCRKTNNSN